MQPEPVQVKVPAGKAFSRISAGFAQGCALAEGAAWCWVSLKTVDSWAGGWWGWGRSCGRHNTGSTCSAGFVQCFSKRACPHMMQGNNNLGRLGNGESQNKAVLEPVAVIMPVATQFQQISLGFTHTCALDLGGSVWCW